MNKVYPKKIVLIKYEQLALRTNEVLMQLMKEINFELKEKPKPDNAQYHIIYGNRMIRDFNLNKIKLDEDWKSKLKWYHNLAIHILTFPTNWIYGYGIKK